MAYLEIRDLKMTIGKTEILKGISFSMEKGECLSVIGPSGSGKSTLLRILNDLEEADSGEIRLEEDGRQKDRFGLIFQQFHLFPQYTALENVSLALRIRKLCNKEEADSLSRALLKKMGLEERGPLSS